jgi:hypothetical protein
MRLLLKFLGITLLLFVVISSCKKTLSDTEYEGKEVFDAAAAKEWYYGVFKKSAEWKSSPEAGKKLPVWKHGTHRKLAGMDFVEYPLLKAKTGFPIPTNGLTITDRKKIFTASLKTVTFIKNKGEVIMREINYIPDWEYLKKNNYDISSILDYSKENDFTGKMIVKEWGGKDVSTQFYKDGKLFKILPKDYKKITFKKGGSQNTSSLGECMTLYCKMWQDCDEYPDGLITNCGEPYPDPNDCYEEPTPGCITGGSEECNTNPTPECICDTYGIGCSGGGGGNPDPEECDPSAVYPEEQEFNSYTSFSTPNSEDNIQSLQDSILNSGIHTWIVASGQSWSIKANSQYGFYTYRLFDLNTNSFVKIHDFVTYFTSPPYFVGSSTVITTTFTLTTPVLSQILENNTEYARGKSIVVGTVRHVMNAPVRLPFCQPLSLDKTDDVFGENTIKPL